MRKIEGNVFVKSYIFRLSAFKSNFKICTTKDYTEIGYRNLFSFS